MGKTRVDDFEKRRNHLKNLSNEELKSYFWKLAYKTVEPLIELAQTHTSPAIERSVLLRMGFSSLEAKALVEKVIDHQLIGKGAGHIVYRLSKLNNLSIREAGLMLLNDQGWEEIHSSFEVKK
jgi:D-ornithine 4,5-aminomutase subunit alpha